MKDEHLLDDQDLASAFREVRDTYDGTNPEASVTLQRALFRTRKLASRQRVARWGLMPIAAVLAASTAWAGVTGKLVPAVHSVLETLHVEAPRTVAVRSTGTNPNLNPSPSPNLNPSPDPSPNPSPDPSPDLSPDLSPTPSPSPSIEPPAPAPLALRDPAKRSASVAVPVVVPDSPGTGAGATGGEPVAAPAVSAPDPNAPLFAEAHRIHFVERDPARALAAWDRYLAVAPAGRFAPEARYNRALSLVRLGRTDEARPELEAFARGTYGNYRRDEAKALLDALGR